ncbi:MAG TPA: hypothetical protein VIN59_09590 [Alphaproteobacteria bacterium]
MALLFLTPLLAAAIWLHSNSTVAYERIVVPEEVYVGKTCNCRCILDSRPWYSKFNYWFWLFIISAPILMFSLSPVHPLVNWQKLLIASVSILLCYVLTTPALELGHDIRNGPFTVYDFVPFQKSMDLIKCHGGSGGAARAFIPILGWFYAVSYTGFWEILWQLYHRKYSRKIPTKTSFGFLSSLLMTTGVLGVTCVLIVFGMAALFLFMA